MRAAIASLALLLLAAPSPAQQPPTPAVAPPDAARLEGELQKTAVQALLGFARAAEADKVRSRAKAAYELILERYEADNRPARTVLGFRKEKGEWRPAPADKLPKWDDAATAQQRQRVEAAWNLMARKLGGLHRTLGLQLVAQDELARGMTHLQAAVWFDPSDAEAHQALGHQRHQGFFGTEAQIGFLQRLAAIKARARELGALDSKPEALPQSALPVELQRTGLTFTGARTANLTIWATAPQDHVDSIAQWGERAVLLLEHLLGNSLSTYPVRSRIAGMRWFGMLSRGERDLFIDKNPEFFGKLDASIVRVFAGFPGPVAGGRAHVNWDDHEHDFDKIVAHVTRYGFARHANDGFGEGLVHSMTWLLLGTTWTWYGNVPSTVSQYSKPLSHDPETWLQLLREQIDQHADMPLPQIPRERLENFRPDVRIKSWSFMLWLLARHPERWARLLHAFPKDQPPLPEAVTAILERELEVRLPDLEAEWREWAAGRSALAQASGHGR